MSREFFDLVKAIGECRSKQEEDKIIENEIAALRTQLSIPSNLQNSKKVREFLIRAIYVEMLGHDASGFAYIHGVNLCHNASLIAKRVGYLVCSLFLDPSNELMILLINTIQKDLKSSNLLQVSFALIVVSRLANLEMVPVLVPLVTPLLGHASEMIRRRAVVGFHRLVQIGGDSISAQTVHQIMRRSLSDSDPGVMAVGLNLVFDVAQADPQSCIDLVPSLTGILKQVIDHRLPRDFDYHRMPAPWMQMRLVAVLAVLGRDNELASTQMYEVLQETIRRADVGSNAGAAIVLECIKCVVGIVPNHTLLECCSLVVSKFLASDNPNYKYLGVTGLNLIVTINPVYANEHQMLVVECLDDSDDSLRRKTLDLLTQMTNPANVTVVVEKMLNQLAEGKADEVHFKTDLVSKICTLCERFAPSNQWYLLTINQVFDRVGGADDHVVDPSVGENLTRLVAEQDGSDGEEDDLRVTAANEYIQWLERFSSSLPGDFSGAFVKLIVWMIGEFATLATLEGYTLDDTIDLLIDCANRLIQDDRREFTDDVIGYFVTAVAKNAVLGSEVANTSARQFLESLLKTTAVPPEIHRRCREYLFVLRQPVHLQRALLPFDAACEDIQVDLSFLDGFASNARKAGAREYSKPSFRQVTAKPVVAQPNALTGLRFEAYQAPQPVVVAPIRTSGLTTPAVASPVSAKAMTIACPPAISAAPQLALGAGKRWGPQGFNGPVSQPPPPALTQPAHAPVRSPEVVRPRPAETSSAPSQPAQLSQEFLQKQRMAAALFSGVQPFGQAPSAASRSVKRAPAPAAQAVDLLDLGGSPPSAPATIISDGADKTVRKVSDMSDLLGLH